MIVDHSSIQIMVEDISAKNQKISPEPASSSKKTAKSRNDVVSNEEADMSKNSSSLAQPEPKSLQEVMEENKLESPNQDLQITDKESSPT